MQVQDLESAEHKLRNELARISTLQSMSGLLGEGRDSSKLDELIRRTRLESDEDFQFVNSMGISTQ